MRIPGFPDRTDTTTVTPLTATTAAPATVHSTAALGGAAHPLNQTIHETHVVHDRDRAGDRDRLAHEVDKAEKAGYQRGLRDGVRARRNNPILMILVLLLAVFGVAVGVLAALEGSFAGGGARVDRGLGVAAVEARDTGGELAQDAGAALQREGAAVERSAEAARP